MCKSELYETHLMNSHQAEGVFDLCQWCSEHQVSKWILNSQENNGILVVTTLPSGNWMESLMDASAYLVIFSDDGRTGASNQSYLGKVVVALHSLED